jgi:ribA/ribD-fused uncharacterized protein
VSGPLAPRPARVHLPAPGDVIARFTGPWAFLSNFHRWPVRWEGVTFPSAEHAFQAGKVDDLAVREAIARVATPQGAKLRGRRLQLRDGWDDRLRFEVMAGVLRAKFTASPVRMAALLATAPAVLVEGNSWHDQTWGDCCCGRPACRARGENHLGRSLMTLRDEFTERIGES